MELGNLVRSSSTRGIIGILRGFWETGKVAVV